MLSVFAWKCINFALIFERQICQLTVFSLVFLSRLSYILWPTMFLRCELLSLLTVSFVSDEPLVSSCFQEFLLVFDFQYICYEVSVDLCIYPTLHSLRFLDVQIVQYILKSFQPYSFRQFFCSLLCLLTSGTLLIYMQCIQYCLIFL